jgi:hypothetical protein
MNFAGDYYFYRARYYEPGVGRFTQRDPLNDIRYAYAYAGNRPTMFVDPWGLRECGPGDYCCHGTWDILHLQPILYAGTHPSFNLELRCRDKKKPPEYFQAKLKCKLTGFDFGLGGALNFGLLSRICARISL